MVKVGRHLGFTLTEILVVISIGVLLLAMVMPAYDSIVNGAKQAQTENVISALLAAARAHAARTQEYAGVRFQFDRDGWRRGKQYAVLIEREPERGYGGRFVAVPNAKPLVLPMGMGVISAEVGGLANNDHRNDCLDDDRTNDEDGDIGRENDDRFCLDGATVFTIIFSPAGKLVVVTDAGMFERANDTLFGSADVVNGIVPPSGPARPILYYDNYEADWQGEDPCDIANSVEWCEKEDSATGLYIFDVGEMAGVAAVSRYTDYVAELEAVLINAYTGMIIDE